MPTLYQAATHLVSYALFATAIGFTGAGVWNLQRPAHAGAEARSLSEAAARPASHD